jgi:hypothetical protein
LDARTKARGIQSIASGVNGGNRVIKELMRRTAQVQYEMAAAGALDERAVDGALQEMLFSGGTLNLKLLGGAGVEYGFAEGTALSSGESGASGADRV